MEFSIKYDEKNQIIKTRLKGNLSAKQAYEILIKMLKFGLLRKSRRFLFDWRDSAIKESRANISKFFKRIHKPELFDSQKKIALLYSDISIKHKFIEKAAREAGINLQVFSNNKKAVKWLKE